MPGDHPLPEVEIRLVVDTLHEGCDAEPNLPRQIAERIGVQEQAIQRYEATGYFGGGLAGTILCESEKRVERYEGFSWAQALVWFSIARVGVVWCNP